MRIVISPDSWVRTEVQLEEWEEPLRTNAKAIYSLFMELRLTEAKPVLLTIAAMLLPMVVPMYMQVDANLRSTEAPAWVEVWINLAIYAFIPVGTAVFFIARWVRYRSEYYRVAESIRAYIGRDPDRILAFALLAQISSYVKNHTADVLEQTQEISTGQ